MIVSNSSPLIYLTKVKRLHLLKDLFREVLIPEEVKTEVVDKGKERGEMDAFMLEREVKAGWITVEKVTRMLDLKLDLHAGEKAAISLAKQRNSKIVLMDEIAGRTAAKLAGVEPRGTIFVLLLALRQKKITFNEFLDLLSQLAQEGFRLHEEVYTAAVKEAQRIAKR